jgi:isopentenyl-diphosphate delta-isomerase
MDPTTEDHLKPDHCSQDSFPQRSEREVSAPEVHQNFTQESIPQFEGRKKDHIRLALSPENEAVGGSGLNRIQLIHEALPDIDFSEVSVTTEALGEQLPTPFLVSSMTAGHGDAVDLNVLLAKACSRHGWMMGVGSQRRELFDSSAQKEWKLLRSQVPDVRLVGNLGLAQVIQTPVSEIQKLVDSLGAIGLFVHCNALQECVQPEGTPFFKGGYKALESLCRELSVPVIVKETGCGMSSKTLSRLNETGVHAVDVSGFGGTHWGRIEGGRAPAHTLQHGLASTFANWGISTVESVVSALELKPKYEIWASGGVRTGLDAAKLLAMGASIVGFAKPILQAALLGEMALDEKMKLIELELKTALFCTGCSSVKSLRESSVWQWRKI